MACKTVLEAIDALNEEYLDILEDLCNIESPTANKAAVDKVTEYIVAWAEKLGLDVDVRPMEKAGNPACITLNPESTAASVVLSGHIDTVHPLGLFGTPAVHRDEEFMYGPGVLDCKGGVVAAMLAIEALQKSGFTARPVKLIVQTDEETSSITSDKKTIEYMIEKSQGAAAFLNCEGCVDYKAVLYRKGIVRFRLHVHGKAVHSSVCYEGANAVAEAAHKILKLEEMKDTEGLTCNCAVIAGGTVANTVAAECNFLVDIRFASEEQYQQALKTVQEVAENSTIPGCTCDVENVSYRPAMELVDRNVALYERINAIYADNGVHAITKNMSRGGSDAAYTTRAGIPTIDSLGTDGSGTHSVREKIKMSSLAESAKRLATVAAEL